MESNSTGVFLPFVTAAVVGLCAAPVGLRAADGEVLVEFQSLAGTSPETQEWIHEGHSLRADCPSHRDYEPCRYQGAQDLDDDSFPDNNCQPGQGCHKSTEHYNSPDPLAYAEATGEYDNSYMEWIGYDNGNLQSPKLLVIPDSTISHSPPWGAPSFIKAPSYPVLRVVTGDGNNVPDTLPIINSPNHRNMGKARIRKTFNPPTSDTVTLLVKAAAGPRSAARQFIEVRVFGRRFALGVDGTLASPTYGRFTLVDADSGNVTGTLFDKTVLVAQPGTPGPHEGEFFHLRIILRNDGTFQATLNDGGDDQPTGTFNVTSATPPNEVLLTPIAGDDTMWFDFIQLLEGELPLLCPDPVVDFNRDGRVDSDDLSIFFDCSNGPGIPMRDTFACHCADRNEDGCLDMTDFAVLQRCLMIGSAVLDPSCDD